MLTPKQVVPNPVRYVCDRGHLHPSHRAAVHCNIKHREAK